MARQRDYLRGGRRNDGMGIIIEMLRRIIAVFLGFLYEICYHYSGLRVDSLKNEVEK